MKTIFGLYNRFILPPLLSLFFLRAGCGVSCVLKKRKGQGTVEFILMLSVVAGMAVLGGILFHKKLMGAFFTIVGMIIGGGTPT